MHTAILTNTGDPLPMQRTNPEDSENSSSDWPPCSLSPHGSRPTLKSRVKDQIHPRGTSASSRLVSQIVCVRSHSLMPRRSLRCIALWLLWLFQRRGKICLGRSGERSKMACALWCCRVRRHVVFADQVLLRVGRYARHLLTASPLTKNQQRFLKIFRICTIYF